MPHRPSNSEVAEPLPLTRCFNCLWNESTDPCPSCTAPTFGTMAEAVEAIRTRRRLAGNHVAYAYSPEQEARLIAEEERQERDAAARELGKLLPLEENPVRAEKLRERAQWEVRTWSQGHLPKWTIPPGTKVARVEAAMPEPLRAVIADRITGEQYNVIRYTDNGVIATLDGCDEYFLPAGAYDTLLV